MNDTIISLLLKVKELAERGIAGERECAKEKLRSLMKKYGIKPADLESRDLVKCVFRYRRADEKILGVCLAQVVCGRRNVPCQVLPKKTIIIYMTAAQRKEWANLYSHYRLTLAKERSLFLPAFLHRQDIHPPAGGKKNDLSPEEIAMIMAMLGYIKRDPYKRMSTLIGGYNE